MGWAASTAIDVGDGRAVGGWAGGWRGGWTTSTTIDVGGRRSGAPDSAQRGREFADRSVQHRNLFSYPPLPSLTAIPTPCESIHFPRLRIITNNVDFLVQEAREVLKLARAEALTPTRPLKVILWCRSGRHRSGRLSGA